MKNYLWSLYLRQMFFPGWLGIFVNPFYFARAGLRNAITELAPKLTGQLLDVGCGSKPYQQLFRVDRYIGLDIDSEAARQWGIADYFYDGSKFPFDDGSFDSILCNQVLEHVFNPDEFVSEIVRVLKPNGHLLLTVPFIWDEHEQPWDFARYTSFGLKDLLERNGLVVLEQRKTNADVRVLFQLINAYLFKITQTSNVKLNVVICFILMAPFNLLGIVLNKLLPANPDLYLDQVVLANKRVG
jgi:SAM-dependent methyltransferase